MTKRLYFSILIWSCSIIVSYAQSVYMHEAQEDAMHSNSDGINSILGILGLICIGLFVIIFLPLMIGEKISDIKFSKKFDRRYDLINSEAYTVLSRLSLTNPDFAKINQTQNWKEWFRKGYYDGVDNGEKEGVWNESVRPREWEKISWEEYSERKFTLLASQDIWIKFECGGDAKMAKLAHDEGRRQGIERRNKKGDSREILN